MIQKTAYAIQNMTVYEKNTKKKLVDKVTIPVLKEGKIYGIFGESGCGKTTLAKSLFDALPNNLIIEKDHVHLPESRQFIFQNPQTTLNPHLTIGQHLWETSQDKVAIDEYLRLFRFENLIDIKGKFPHQLSGGMCQRIVMILSLLGNPKFIIADEPTTALDLETQSICLSVLKQYVEKQNALLLWISHDLHLLSQIADVFIEISKGKIIKTYSKNSFHTVLKNQITKRWQSPQSIKTSKSFVTVSGLQKKYGNNTVLDNINIEVFPNENIGIIGESGSGKSTLARLITASEYHSKGNINYAKELKKLSIQMVFQDVEQSLNPKQTIWQILSYPIFTHRMSHRKNIKKKVIELLESVKLQADILDFYPSQISGGMKQRVSVARALSVQPKILICDEATSQLDSKTQMDIIDLLLTYQKKTDLSIIFISHDIQLTTSFCHKTYVMNKGKIIEKLSWGDTPKSSYTKKLFSFLTIQNFQ